MGIHFAIMLKFFKHKLENMPLNPKTNNLTVYEDKLHLSI